MQITTPRASALTTTDAMRHGTVEPRTRRDFAGGRSSPLRCRTVAGLLVFVMPSLIRAAEPAPYPKMAPLEQYLMPRESEIALARSAGPTSITGNAEVMVLEPQGYQTAIAGSNGFVCVVERSWSAPSGDPEFWNPATRGPICFNPAAARYCVPLLIKRTAMVLAGRPRSEIVAGMKAARDAREFPVLEPGAMCFMMAKGGHLNNAAGHWHPHLMFFSPLEESAWGANLPGSPVVAVTDDLDHLTVFMVPVRTWSDGSDESQPEVCAPPESASVRK